MLRIKSLRSYKLQVHHCFIFQMIQNVETEFSDAATFDFSVYEVLDGTYLSDVDDIQTSQAAYQTDLNGYNASITQTVLKLSSLHFARVMFEYL